MTPKTRQFDYNYGMDAKLERQFKRLEDSKNALLMRLEQLPPAKLSEQPVDKSWSAMQVISHLIKVEEGTMNYMKKKLSYRPPLKKTGILTALKIGLTNFAMRLPFKYKTTDFLEEAGNNITFDEGKAHWAKTREQMRDFFEGLSKEELNAALHRNLLAGRVNVYQQLSFIQVHFERHVRQIERILKAVK